ncbi:hypothetical protein VNI00_010266 [Paramarasmius palmivorus]|uniref:Uncharacterized protein n=1 Tax=Paramarasmius palmivorus TaxID=297713 RepID=A0AAW0CJ20_9AGAR
MSYRSDTTYPRRVIVDDTDPRVQYVGDWTLDVGSFDNLGIPGPPYNHTLWGTKQDGASFLFDFEGEFIQVRGAKDNPKLPPDPDLVPFENVTLLAKWSCTVDGDAITPLSHLDDTSYMTHIVLCEQGFLSRKKHTLNRTVFIEDPDTQMFWVDEIEYQPLEVADLQNEILKINSSDSSVEYHNESKMWFPDPQNIMYNQTGTTGITATLSFTRMGTQVVLYGINRGFDLTKGSARYRIDHSMEVDFETPESRLAPDGLNTSDYYHQLIFTTPKLKLGSHEIDITFTGPGETEKPLQWLTIDYFYITSGEDAAQLNYTGTNGSTGGETIQGESPNSESRTPTGAIIGGVLGGVVGLVLLVGNILLALKCRGKRISERPGVIDHENIFASPEIFSHGITSEPLTISEFGASPPSTSYSTAEPCIPSNWKDMKNAQRNAVAEAVVERRHQDSGIRYSQRGGHSAKL